MFSSRVQYVDVEVKNYRFSGRQMQLPRELLDIADENLKNRISSRVRAVGGAIGPFDISVETAGGKAVVKADEKWLSGERKRIEDVYTFVVPSFGRVIFNTERQVFDGEIERFRHNLNEYHRAVLTAVENIKADLQERLVKEYLPRWCERPPEKFARFGIPATKENLEKELRSIVQNLIAGAIAFEAPRIRVVYKSIAPESVRDPEFVGPLRKIMQRRGVPLAVIESLFASGDAAPVKGGLRTPS